MTNLIFKKNYKIIILILIVSLLSFGFILIYNQGGNDSSGILAAEVKPINCKKQTEVQLPLGQSAKFGPNEAEIPIGKAIDKTEEMAKKIIDNLLLIFDAAEEERIAALTIKNLGSQCGINRCSTPGCYEKQGDCLKYDCDQYGDLFGENGEYLGPDYSNCIKWSDHCAEWDIICVKPSCGGDACPWGIGEQLNIVYRQADRVKTAYDTIKGILYDWRPVKPIGNWWIPTCPTPPLPANPLCWTEREFILKELERARSGDYQDWSGSWVRAPAGLKDCVIRPEDREAVLRGEKAGKMLLSCKDALSAGLIDQKSCYGQTACQAEREAGRTPPADWNCPRAENYYCCE